MTLSIEFQGESFPTRYPSLTGVGRLLTSWDDLLWAALTVGRPSLFQVFRFGVESAYEATFRLMLIRACLKERWDGQLERTAAFNVLDPTEKAMLSYFTGMTVCKLFADRLLNCPWILHLDAFRAILNPSLLGRSRPDLVGQDVAGRWHCFESKGRSSSLPSQTEKDRAKAQSQMLTFVNGAQCELHVGAFTFFRRDVLEFYWRDPEPDHPYSIELPDPGSRWRYYYGPALGFVYSSASSRRGRPAADVVVDIHPRLLPLLEEGRWSEAKSVADNHFQEFVEEGFHRDGIKVLAGESWRREAFFTEG